MTTAQQPTKDSILANLNKLKEQTQKAAEPGEGYTPTFTPKTLQPKPATFRKGGLMDQAEDVSLSDQAKELTDFIGGISMMDAIKMWGKPQKGYKSTGPQSILIRCPKPEHVDNDPSCSVELGKGLFHCFSCEAKGDKYTLAAIHHGLDLHTYQDGHNFVELKEKMALDLGYTVTESAGVKMVQAPMPAPNAPAPVVEHNPAPSTIIRLDDGSFLDQATGELVDTPVRPQPVQLTGGVFGANATVEPAPKMTPIPVDLSEFVNDEVSIRAQPSLDWIPLGKNQSFIDTYMEYVGQMSYPDEYGFAAALICLGFVGERRARIQSEETTFGNLGIITVGGTGIGKTRAIRHAQAILDAVMPWKRAELAIGAGGQIVPGTGVKDIAGAASGENLIKQFQDVVKVPNGSNADGSTHFEEEYQPVNGVIVYEEYETFIGKASSNGSTLRQRLMNFLDGAVKIENTTNTQGDSKAVKPYASLYTSVQPSVIHKIMNEHDEQTGFLNRVAFFTGKPKATHYYRDKGVDNEPVIKALRELRDYWNSLSDPKLTFGPGAREKAVKYQESVIEPLRQSGQGIYGRLNVAFDKVMVLFCVNEMTTTITPDIVDKAIHMTKYLTETYKYVSDEIYNPSTKPSIDNLDDRIIKRILDVMEKKKAKGNQTPEGYAVFTTEIRRSVARHLDRPGATPSQILTRALKSLVDAGEISSLNTSRGVAYYRS